MNTWRKQNVTQHQQQYWIRKLSLSMQHCVLCRWSLHLHHFPNKKLSRLSNWWYTFFPIFINFFLPSSSLMTIFNFFHYQLCTKVWVLLQTYNVSKHNNWNKNNKRLMLYLHYLLLHLHYPEFISSAKWFCLWPVENEAEKKF